MTYHSDFWLVRINSEGAKMSHPYNTLGEARIAAHHLLDSPPGEYDGSDTTLLVAITDESGKIIESYC